jgi:peptidoglycan-associated lipoprotein
MTRSRHSLLCFAAVVLVVVAFGCARRPSVTQVVAPPPTGPIAVAPAPPAPTPTPPAVQPPPAAVEPPPAPAPVETARPAPKEFVSDPQLPDIYFDFDTFVLRPEAAKVLRASAEWLNAHADRALLIEGHCDERGTEAYNLALGQRRATSARDFLVAHGVPTARISLVSYGKERPQCSEGTEECWSQNRRAHFVLKAQ